jgi:hypothetical protein
MGWRRLIVVLGMTAGAIATGPVAAHASVTRTDLQTSLTRTFEAPGCHLVDLQTLHETVQGQLVDINGSTHIDLLLSGTVSFDESGESFFGRYSLPVTMFQQTDGSFASTGSYTAVAMGDEGHVAMLHHNVHMTFVAPDRLDITISNLEHTCA